MSDLKAQVIERLRRVKGPDLDSNIVDLGLVSDVLIKDGRVYFSITVPAARAEELEPLRGAAEKVVREVEGVTGVVAVLTAEAAPGAAAQRVRQAETAAPARNNGKEHPRVAEVRARGTAGDGARAQAAPQAAPVRQTAGVPGVKHIVAVASGKGGVGKSTVAVNLALGFQAIGLKAGIMDADIYGPSQPRMMGVTERPTAPDGKTLIPIRAHGVTMMSLGLLLRPDEAVIWRGPILMGAMQQMLGQVAWGDLDVLVIDLPPGTGDVQLTLGQRTVLTGAVVVSTPQDVALLDARRAIDMFRKLKTPILGLVENMSTFICPNCGHESHIFGHGGVAAEAERLGVPFLGEIPLALEVRVSGDAGTPVAAGEGPISEAYARLARRLIDQGKA